MDLTSDLVYCRLHGSAELYRSRYEPAELARWAGRIAAWAAGAALKDGTFVGEKSARDWPRDVFVFFDNTDRRHAPSDAADLMRLLDVHWRTEPKSVAQ